MKVKIKSNIRNYESDDSDFNINAGEVKELFDAQTKSYSIKYHLFNGNLIPVEGEVLIKIKHAEVLFSSETHPWCYGIEFGKFFKKNLESGQTFWIDKDDITNFNPSIFKKLTGLQIVEVTKEEPKRENSERFKIEDFEVKDFEKESSNEEPVEEPPKEEGKLSSTDILCLKKSEQIQLLKNLGLKASEIKKLNTEPERVAKILELQ
jgi:hypothetical protein